MSIALPKFSLSGLFLAFRAHDHHFWLFYPRIDGQIITDPTHLETDKRKLFNWLRCKESDFPAPEDLPPAPFDSSIFPVLGAAVEYLFAILQRQQNSAVIPPKMTALMQSIHQVVTEVEATKITPTQLNVLQPTAIQSTLPLEFPIDPSVLRRVKRAITKKSKQLKIFESDLKKLWELYKDRTQWVQLIESIDEYFVENELYSDEDEEDEIKPLEIIKRENIKLICYEWFENGKK